MEGTSTSTLLSCRVDVDALSADYSTRTAAADLIIGGCHHCYGCFLSIRMLEMVDFEIYTNDYL